MMVINLIKRNIKLFFKDKGMFFTALITPGILLVLYATFLGNVYKDSFMQGLPEGLLISEDIIDGLVASQLISSILAVSCVTVSFCANFLMVQDKANGTIKDLRIAPVKSSVLSISYYIATIISTLIICYSALILSLIYVAIMGWYLSFADVLLLLLDTTLVVLFGTAISSLINYFISTQGQISAVGTIVSAGYGFICGAYMPIYSFSDGLQKVVSFLPGTYATSLFRNHAMRGVFDELSSIGMPEEVLTGMKDMLDYNFYFFGNEVNILSKYLILIVSIIVIVGIYIVLNATKIKKV